MTTVDTHNPVDAVDALVTTVPPGLSFLTAQQVKDLHRATDQLVAVTGKSGQAELARFRTTRQRTLAIDTRLLHEVHCGTTILVTGGTGCIGSSLIRELGRLGPGRIISVSRGSEYRWPRWPGVEYVNVDVRDRKALLSLFAATTPDLVYHLAAQRDPGLAEKEVHRTISTNAVSYTHLTLPTKRIV